MIESQDVKKTGECLLFSQFFRNFVDYFYHTREFQCQIALNPLAEEHIYFDNYQ